MVSATTTSFCPRLNLSSHEWHVKQSTWKTSSLTRITNSDDDSATLHLEQRVFTYCLYAINIHTLCTSSKHSHQFTFDCNSVVIINLNTPLATLWLERKFPHANSRMYHYYLEHARMYLVKAARQESQLPRRAVLVNSCHVSRAMEVRKVSNNKSDLQGHSRALALVPLKPYVYLASFPRYYHLFSTI